LQNFSYIRVGQKLLQIWHRVLSHCHTVGALAIGARLILGRANSTRGPLSSRGGLVDMEPFEPGRVE